MAIRTWTCLACNRRVPATVALCRCGASRSEAQANEALREIAQGHVSPRRHEPLPNDVKVWLVVTGLALVGALVFAARAAPPPPVAPLLGWVEQSPPSPSPYKPPARRR